MALIPPRFIDCVVALGVRRNEGEGPEWVATGFFYGHPVGPPDAAGEYRVLVYLVSNRHVFEGLDGLCLRFSPQVGGPVRDYDLTLTDDNGEPLWFHPSADDVDVAVIPVNYHQLQQDGMRAHFFSGKKAAKTIAELREMGIMEGDFVYALGYPMGLVGERPTVILRMGVIARIRDALADAENTFLIDAAVFPGNSGGPVVLKPELASIVGTEPIGAASVVGIVRGYVPYRDVAISQQTKKPRIIFEENSGLAVVHPMDYVQEAIKQHADKWNGKKDTTGTPVESSQAAE